MWVVKPFKEKKLVFKETKQINKQTRNVSGRNTYAPPGRNVSDTKWFWRNDIPVT